MTKVLNFVLECSAFDITLHPLRNVEEEFYMHVMNKMYAIRKESGKRRIFAVPKCRKKCQCGFNAQFRNVASDEEMLDPRS